jgi:hypothetical protein
MKKVLLLTLFLFSLNYLVTAQTHHFNFEIKDKSELQKLTRIISIDNIKGTQVWAYANDKEFAEFSALNYKITELPLHENQAKVINMATTVAQMVTWDRYPTYDVYVQMMKNFALNYPTLCVLDTIGNTQHGRQVLVIKISSNVTQHEAKPEFFYSSTMHGDETTGMILMLRLADYLLSNYGTNTEATDLVDNTEIYITPDSNPDGTYYGGNSTVSGAQRYLYDGTDPNRNFPYPGNPNTPYALETQGMMAFGTAHHFIMSANFHGGNEVYNYPWDCWRSSENTHADDAWFAQLGQNYVSLARTLNSSYMTGVTSNGVTEGADWYYAYGSRQDFMNYFCNCKEVTVELSYVKTPSSDQLPTYWNYTKQSFLNYIKEVRYGFNGTVKNSEGNPIDAKIEIAGHDKDNSFAVSDTANGDYYRPIAPGTYNVTYSAYGYISQTIPVTVAAYETTTIQNVVLLHANQVTVSGIVTEAGTGTPIGGAIIQFAGTSIPNTITASDGTYSISNVFENSYQISVTKPGYTSQTENVSIFATNSVFDFQLNISNAISFETTVPSIFTFAGNAPWTQVTDATSYDGTHCMKSGTIDNSQSSTMQILNYPVSSTGNISFYKKVSSESGYDFLKFYIDAAVQGSGWSGTVAWSQETYPVSTGNHTFKWTYSKDKLTIGGSDCAWVDYIELPPSTSDTNDLPFAKNSVSVFPNPFSNFTCFHFNLQKTEDVTIQIIDINGKVVQNVIRENMSAGDQTIYWNTNSENGNLKSGIYFYKISSADFNQYGKMIVK